MKSFRLTPKQYEALSNANDEGFVNAHGRTIAALESYGLVESVHGWTEQRATRYHPTARATERVWGRVGYVITYAGIQERHTEDYRRKQIARFRNA